MADVTADLLAAASELLRTDGPAALSVRRVAEAAGCSTMAIYSRFGGKSGLLDALARDGFVRMADALESAQVQAGGGPVDEITAMCMTVREVAIADPPRYRLMFGPLAEPSSDTRAAARRSLAALADAVTRAASSGSIEVSDPEAAAEILFAVCHGLVGAELAAVLEDGGGGRLAEAVDVALSGLAQRAG